MPLKLYRHHTRGPNWYVRGTLHGVAVDRTTGVEDRDAAEAIRVRWENEIIDRKIHKRKPQRSFLDASLSYLRRPDCSVHEAPRVQRLAEMIGQRPLGDINEDFIVALELAHWPGCQASTLNREVRTPISSVLNHAVSMEWCEARKIKRYRVKLKTIEWTQPEKIQAAIDSAPDHVRPLLLFYVGTGARLREAILLDWKWVFLDERRVVFVDAKNGESESVPIPPFVVAALADLPHREGAVFRRPDGQPYEEYVRVRIKKLPRRPYGMHIPALEKPLRAIGLTPHGLRHAYVSYITAKEGLAAANKLARHKSIAMTKRYSHFAPDHLQAAVDKLAFRKPDVTDADGSKKDD